MTEYNIGSKLKKLRLASRLTLQSVAGEIGFSTALLSQIENDNVSPPIATLSKLAKFFGVKMSSFFAEDGENPRYEIIRKDNRKTVSQVISPEGTNHGYSYESFSFKMQEKKMTSFLITLSGKVSDKNTYSHEGEAFIYVVNGACEILLDTRDISLEEGDSLYFDTSMEHRYRSKDDSGGTILIVERERP
jgi:transcriptional regulator with XRE-family HTH domain